MRKGEETRHRILNRAMELASAVGFEGLSIGQLAEETDMSKSGLFAHFDSKEDLQLQILDTARATFIENVFAPALRKPRGEPRIRALFDRWIAWEKGVVTPGGCPFIAAAAEFDDRPGPVRDSTAAVLRELLDALAKAFRLGIESGHFRPDLDPDQLAFELYGIIFSFHLHHRLLGNDFAEERALAAFEDLLDRSRSTG